MSETVIKLEIGRWNAKYVVPAAVKARTEQGMYLELLDQARILAGDTIFVPIPPVVREGESE